MRFLTLALTSLVGRAVCASIRGANTWYAYFGSSNETETLAAARYMSANLLRFGYDTITLDEGWAYENGTLLIDGNGRPRANPRMFPRGLPWLSAQMKSMGIKLGLWVLRGVPREAVARKLPILNSTFSCDEAVRYDRNCSWASDTWGSNAPSEAANDYYASLAELFASYGASLVKVDCLWPHLYEGTPQTYFNEEVVAVGTAFAADFTLSMSPGISVSPLNGSFIAQNHLASMYRIAEDVLDVWDGPAAGTFPQGLHQKFRKALEFEALLNNDASSVDFDMLQLGDVIHSYSNPLPPTPTNLTSAEQRSEITLFSFTGVPLILGGLLPLADNASDTLALLTNAEVLAVHNESSGRKSFVPVESPMTELYGWSATPSSGTAGVEVYVALFSAAPVPSKASVRFADVGLPGGTKHVCMRNLWTAAVTDSAGTLLPDGTWGISFPLDVHASVAALFTPVGDSRCASGYAN